MFSDTYDLFSSHKIRDQVLQPYRTIIVLYTHRHTTLPRSALSQAPRWTTFYKIQDKDNAHSTGKSWCDNKRN